MNELNILAENLKTELGKVVVAFRTALGHARNVGEILAKAKVAAEKAKKSFTAWVKENAGFGLKTASNYIRIFDDWAVLQAEPDFDELTITKALSPCSRLRTSRRS